MIEVIKDTIYFSVKKENIEKAMIRKKQLDKCIKLLSKKYPILFPVIEDYKKHHTSKEHLYYISGKCYSIGDMFKNILSKKDFDTVLESDEILNINLITDKTLEAPILLGCQNQNYANELISFLNDLGYNWCGGNKIKNGTYWNRFKEQTRYSIFRNQVMYTITGLGYYYGLMEDLENVAFCLKVKK